MKARHEFATDEEYYDYLRHYYAGQAMHGLLASRTYEGLTNKQSDQILEEAIILADALIAELSK